MLKKIALVFALTFALVPEIASANDVTCVQEQLLEMGFDPNGVDGMIGGGTRAAASSFLEQSDLQLPPLSANTAGMWCGALTGFAPDVWHYINVCTEQVFPNAELGRRLTRTDVPLQGIYVGEWFDSDDANRIPGTGREHALIVFTHNDKHIIAYFDGNKPGKADDACYGNQLAVDGSTITVKWKTINATATYVVDGHGLTGVYSIEAGKFVGKFHLTDTAVIEAGF